jgi:flagellin
MALSIISNQAASIATRSLGQSNDAATATAEKLSSGKRINSAADDAAGSAIAARLSAEVAGLRQAGVNAGQASSLLQIADGAFQNVEDILTRAKSLSVQAGSDQISDAERSFLDQEFTALKNEIDRIARDTEFNGSKLVDGEIKGYLRTNDSVATTDGAMAGLTNIDAMALLDGGVANVSVMGIEQTFDNANTNGIVTAGTVTGQVGMLTYDMNNNTFMFMASATTSGGNFTAVNFTGTLTADQYSGSNPTMTTAVTLMAADPQMTAGTIKVFVGTAFDTNANLGGPMNEVGVVGSDKKDFTFKVGTGIDTAADEINVQVGGISTTALGINGESIDSKTNADNASVAVSDAIDTLQSKRSEVGAAQNRLDFAGQNVELTRENQEAARSELEDLNVAKAITEFSQQQLLVQAGTSTLSQANSLPQNLLQLFR